MEPTDLAILSEKITAVVADATAASDARHDENVAAAGLLAAVIALLRPAVYTLGSRKFRDHTTDEGIADEYLSGRFLHLAGDGNRQIVGRWRNGRDQNRGAIGGYGLFLRATKSAEDVRLVRIDWDGSWSHWQGEADSYVASETAYEGDDHGALAAVVDGWSDVEEYIATLQAAVQAAGSRAAATKASRARAERLSALTALLKR